MHKLVYIFTALILIQCDSNDSQSSSNSVSNDNQFNHSAQLVELDPLKSIEKEIIDNPNSTNVYLKRALYYKEIGNMKKPLKISIEH